jgi:hypothetical protein
MVYLYQDERTIPHDYGYETSEYRNDPSAYYIPNRGWAVLCVIGFRDVSFRY